ncbi:Ig-like V-type domain-containing protein FAM187A isoform X2 [Xiphophorus couchianus]|uniref:Ig-like V-type domain-containing protein FAM187A isoform X2 n=1 Tax=Xiphophorus couchianus TaxID=32473 RepID=UPI001016C6AF|nr:Ig-like V-type domain-containing protein FAM187A isoform X2 [Xiphophorus couchianus]
MLFSMILRCLVVVLMYSVVWSFEAPEEKKDVFSSTACPAFLTFTNAAYIAGVTVELPCHCKPEEVQSVVWFFRKHWSSFDETRALTDNHGNKLLDTSQVPHSSDLRSRFSIRMFSLLIFKAGPEDSGLYICGSAHKDFFYGYDLDIQEAPTLSFPPSSASVPVPVPVFYLSHPADGVVTLRCPGARPNMVVGWDQGSTPIYRSENTSSGNFYPRITIDTGHHLVFNPAKSQDSGVYYCWLQGRRAAHIRLLVYVHLGKDLTVWADPNFSASMKTLFTYYAVMTAVFCLMLIGRIGYELIRDSGSWCSAPAGEEVNR